MASVVGGVYPLFRYHTRMQQLMTAMLANLTEFNPTLKSYEAPTPHRRYENGNAPPRAISTYDHTHASCPLAPASWAGRGRRQVAAAGAAARLRRQRPASHRKESLRNLTGHVSDAGGSAHRVVEAPAWQSQPPTSPPATRGARSRRWTRASAARNGRFRRRGGGVVGGTRIRR